MYEFKVTMNDEDYIHFNQYHLMNSPAGKRTLLYFRLVIPIICIGVVTIFMTSNSDYSLVLSETIAMTMISILWIVFSKKMILRNVAKNIKKVKKAGRLPYVKESILKFDDDGIHEIAPDTESRTKYSVVEKIVLTDKAICIYFSAAQAYIVPMNVFSEELERNRFLEFLHMKTGK